MPRIKKILRLDEAPWLRLGAIVLKKKSTLSIRTFKTFFKLRPFLVEKVFNKLRRSNGAGVSAKHLLWTLFYLKTRTPDETSIAQSLSIDKGTMVDRVFDTLAKIRKLLPKVVKFYCLFKFAYFISLNFRTDFEDGRISVLHFWLI